MTKGDSAFTLNNIKETKAEMTYGGALSYLRRKYTKDLKGIDVAVSGIPYDNAVTYRPGARFGPSAIRAASTQLAELKAFPYGFNPFDYIACSDYGDCFINPHRPETVIESIENHAATIIKSGAIMLTFGGDHFTSYPLLKAHAQKYGPLALIQFDAHSDTWPDDGECLDHGTMFARAVKENIIDPKKSIQVGLRTHNDHSFDIEILTSPFIHRHGVDKVIELIKERVGNHPAYISFDIDVLDPAFAPGTGTPVIGGLASWQAQSILSSLGELNLIGMDIVEVSPPYDQSDITAIAAANMGLHFLCMLAIKNGAKINEQGRIR